MTKFHMLIFPKGQRSLRYDSDSFEKLVVKSLSFFDSALQYLIVIIADDADKPISVMSNRNDIDLKFDVNDAKDEEYIKSLTE